MTDGSEESAAAGYGVDATQRRFLEATKRSDRSPFARDRARVLHSSALRRLAAKTQVVVPWEDDFPRTRLTHSLECAQIGRELGASLGCDADLVETACLAHDLGHPPFGHNGEMALDLLARPCGGFEGNAQSLRILTRLEAKVLDDAGRSAGLNLTRATLDASCKYPWPRQEGSTKFGVYDDDRDVFAWLRQGAPEGRRCLEAQVMDWADDVAYSVHDFEDAVHAGHLLLDSLSSVSEQRELITLARERYAPRSDEQELHEALERLVTLPFWPKHFDGGQRALAALKDTTSQLIGRFCQAAESATRERHGPGPWRRYDADLVVPDDVRGECAVLKAVTAHYVMGSAAVADNYARQRDVVTELTSAVHRGAPGTLEPAYREEFDRAADDAGRLRAVVDQVAALTDRAAWEWHRRLSAAGPA